MIAELVARLTQGAHGRPVDDEEIERAYETVFGIDRSLGRRLDANSLLAMVTHTELRRKAAADLIVADAIGCHRRGQVALASALLDRAVELAMDSREEEIRSLFRRGTAEG